jgi:enterobactin synthetase component D
VPSSDDPLLHVSRHGLVVVVSAAPELTAQLEALHPEERAAAAALSPLRQREWVAGRTALREALRRQALLEEAPLLRDDRGAPQVPAAALGSISHKGDRAAALVARRQPGCSLGVDLELVAGPRVDIARRVLTAAELAELDRLGELLGPAARASQLALRFSIKEAIYKAIDPWVRRYVGFREVELSLERGAADTGSGLARAVAPALEGELGSCALEVSWARLGDHWLSTARAQR